MAEVEIKVRVADPTTKKNTDLRKAIIEDIINAICETAYICTEDPEEVPASEKQLMGRIEITSGRQHRVLFFVP